MLYLLYLILTMLDQPNTILTGWKVVTAKHMSVVKWLQVDILT